MSWTSIKAAVDLLISRRPAGGCKSHRRAAIRPEMELLEERLAPATYTTNFDLSEYPISECGAWHHTPNAWTYVRTANGLAWGTNGIANTYDDSYAFLSGFAANQQAQAVIYAPPNPSGAPEAELLLHMADGPNSVRGYE